ncbi:MAG TPA: RdgB/HAM1 family non-canonical purine NTP pyrophosphatase [Dehalococcoidia bacterium]
MSPPRLLIASNNPHKVDEFRQLLAGCGWDIVGPADAGVDIDVDEAGATYEDNARIKARAFAAAAGLPALADDSGLEVDALGGEPGPLHHRLGWDGAGNDERIRILLRRLEGVSDRRARFRAVIVVVFPDGRELLAEGVCGGEIALAPDGQGGFGYDPVFRLADGRTMAQVSPAEKNRISHRGRAVEAIKAALAEAAQ